MRSLTSLLATAALLLAAALPTHAQLQPLTWTVTSPSGVNAWLENMSGIAFGNGRFVSAGYVSGITNGNRIAYSNDLVEWTTATLPTLPALGFGTEYYVHTAAYGNGLFIVGAFGRPATDTQKILTSSDAGVTWTRRDVRLADVWGLDYANGLWIATGNSNQSGPQSANLTTSTDGLTWTPRATGSGDDLNAAAHGNGRYVAVGNNGQVVHSVDGATWTRNVVADPNVNLYDIAFGNGRFVAGADGGRVYTSTDGLTWTRNNLAGPAIRFKGVTFAAGRFVLIGESVTYSSADGLAWTQDSTALRLAVSGTHGNGVFVLGAQMGTIYRSGTPVVPGPVITAQPQSASAVAGGTATFTVTATGAGNTYQWRKDGQNIAGATSATLTLNNITAASAGAYSVVVTNSLGTTTSAAATLTLVTASNAGRLVNMSIRTAAGTGDNTLIVGLGIGGANTSGPKSVLIRGVGPTLATTFGLSSALADPIMTAFQGQTQVAQNDDWSGTFNFASLGAFPFAGSPVRDSAIYNEALPSGSYSIQITGKNNATGLALAEIYDATPGDSFAATTPRLVNVSARTQVGTGDNILIAGFVVGGTTPVRVLIRAAGPALTVLGVGGALADPRLEVLNSTNTRVAENDNWSGAADLKTAFTSVAAFNFPADNSRDAALIATLPPGSYTAQISGVGNTTGVALVELYELP